MDGAMVMEGPDVKVAMPISSLSFSKPTGLSLISEDPPAKWGRDGGRNDDAGEADGGNDADAFCC